MTEEYDPLAPRPDAVTNALSDVATEFRALDLKPIAMTLGILSVFLLGYYIVLPTFSFEVMRSILIGSEAIARVSIMALGVLPWTTAIIIVEVVGIAIRPLRRPLGFVNGHCNPFAPFVLLMAFALVGVQGYGLVISFEATDLIADPGMFSRIALIASLAAGTAVSIVAARLINVYGTGHGFWLVLGFPLPFILPSLIGHLFSLSFSGTSAFWLPLIFALIVLISIISVVVILVRKLFHAGVTSPAPIVLPILVATKLASLAMSAAYNIFGNDLNLFGDLSTLTIYFYAAFSIILMPLLWLSLQNYVRLPVIIFASLSLFGLSIISEIVFELKVTQSPGWPWFSPTGDTVAFIAALTFIVSGVYGRRKVVGNP